MTTSPPKSQSERKDQTREKLLIAAVSVFGQRGFEGATTRMLADQADVNLQAISYYFDGKEGLYTSAIEFIGDQILAQFADTHEQITLFLAAPITDPVADRGEAQRLLTGMCKRLARLYCAPEFCGAARLVVREQAFPTAAFQKIYDRAFGVIIRDVSALIPRMRGGSIPTTEARLLAMSLIGGILVFLVSRASSRPPPSGCKPLRQRKR